MLPVIVACAVSGGIHTPSMSPYLPVTPTEIADSAVEAAEAGASIVHLHARDPANGRPAHDPGLFREIVDEIKSRSDVIINLTTGGGLGMSLDQRLSAVKSIRPEMCSLNLGSMNFGLFPMAEKERDWKHGWEKAFLESTHDFVFKNTFADIETIIREFSDSQTRFEFESYDVGHLYNLAHFADKGLIKPPFYIQTIFGILGGISAKSHHLQHVYETAMHLFGKDFVWSVLAAGRHQLSLGLQGVLMGSNIRVGLEDNLYISKGVLARSNAEQVIAAGKAINAFAKSIATPHDARGLIGLPLKTRK